jgi:N4-gp56 family major capsid protein
MALTTTSTGSLSDDAVDYFIRARMMMHGKSNYRMREALTRDSIPAGNGTNIKFVRVPRIVLAGAITEGTNPTATALDIETVTATAAQYGQIVEVSDVVDLTLKHPLAQAGMKELAESAVRKDDSLIQQVIGAGTQVQYGGGAASRAALAATNYVTTEQIRDAVMQLEMPSNGRDGAAPRYPDGTYLGLFNSRHIQDLLSDTDFRNFAYRQDPEALKRGVVNVWNDVTFKKLLFSPQYSLEALGTSADSGTGTTYDNGATIKYGVVRRDKQRDFAEGIDDAGTHTMSANKDLVITTPSSTDYVYDVYCDSAADGSGTRKLFASRQAGATAVTVTALPTGATIPAAPASGVTVYRSYILAWECASVVDLDSLKTYLVRGSTKSDVLNLKTSMGTKWFDTSAIQNDAHLVIIEAPSRH